MVVPLSQIDPNKKKLIGETAKIKWSELQTFFAKGQVIQVSDSLDLIEVADVISKDDKQRVEVWLASEEVAQVSDEQALAWFESDAVLWSVVVRPWILVQDKS